MTIFFLGEWLWDRVPEEDKIPLASSAFSEPPNRSYIPPVPRPTNRKRSSHKSLPQRNPTPTHSPTGYPEVLDQEPLETPIPSRTGQAPVVVPTPVPVDLIVRTHPWSELYVDNQRLGIVPRPKPFNLSAGSHTLRLEASGQRPVEIPIVLSAGKPMVLTVDLSTGQGTLEPRIK